MRRATAMAVVLASAAVPAGVARGAVSSDVAALQVALRARGLYAGAVDGIRGPGTTAAVVGFQRRRGLVPDGIAGPATRRALGRRGRPALGRRVLHVRHRGWDVAALQFLLGRAGFASGAVDGVLGARTDGALRRFQAWAGLRVDGLAGPGTIAALRRGPPRSVLRFAWPVSAPVGDRFGPRGDRFHTGIDFRAGYGTRVGAAGRGCVTTAGWTEGGYGNLVVIQHRLGMTSWYAHLRSVAVRPGECVVAGRFLGRVGATGHAFGPHLHFELRLRGAAVDPRTGGVG